MTQEKKPVEIGEVIGNIRGSKVELMPAAQHKIDLKTKPLGALGTIEDLAVRMALIKGDLNPSADKKALLVFAGDHGVAEEGVSAFPAEVTPQMVQNFLNGGAAINILCKHHDIDISVIDMGVNYDFGSINGLIDMKVRKGTRNFAHEEAMTSEEVVIALENGMTVLLEKYIEKPFEIIGLGEMGIANTTSASAIISVVTGIKATDAVGRGTGIDDKVFKHKTAVIERALNLHKPIADDGFDILRKIGGYEIAGIAGAVLAAASKQVPVVLDGVISTAAGLIAYLLNPKVGDYLFAGHKSVEIGQKKALEFMDLKPIVDLGMRLGEGTGAAIAMNIIDSACRIMRDMASFEDAGVTNKE